MKTFAELQWRMEANEAAFCSLWTDRIELDKGIHLFINKKMPLDYFYNRLNLDKADNMVLKKAECVFFKSAMNCYVYVHEENTEIQHTLLRAGFTWVDTMDVMMLAREPDGVDEKKTAAVSVLKVKYTEIPIWVRAFCESFEMSDLQDEIQQRVEYHFDKLILLVSYLCPNKSSPKVGGCCALLIDNGTVGLYCLGTVPKFRGNGLARKMMTRGFQYTLNNHLDCLFLQTFENQDLFNFYRQFGFQIAYKKRIFEKKYQNRLKT